jgi:hypothetical protein
MAILSNAIKSSIIKEFYRGLTNPRATDKYFIFYGGVKPREDESVIPVVVDTVEEENSAKRNSVFYNNILPSDVQLMVKRYDWTSGTIYDQYEDDIDLTDKKYYVLIVDENEYRIYMCLSNNGGVLSTTPPQGTSTQELKTSDGYIWKFMYSLTEAMEGFLTENFMPVVEIDRLSYSDERALALDVKLDAINGFIEKITVDEQFVSYSDLVNPDLNNTHTVSSVTGLTFTVNLLSDLATSSNYYNNNYVVYFENGKIGTIKTYTVSNNTATIELCEIYPDNNTGDGNINTGDVYSILPKVNIVGNGYGAVAVPVFTNDILTSFEIINGGSGYSFANAYLLAGDDVTVSVVIPPDGGYGYDIINELRPKHLMIRKDFNYSRIEEGTEYYFGAGSQIRQYGIIKNLKTQEELIVPNSNQNFDMVLIVDQDVQISGTDYYYNGVLDFQLSNITSNATHIIGADTFSSAKIEEITVNPSDSKLINLTVSEVRGEFENAKLNSDGSIALGEKIVFLKKTESGVSNTIQLVSAPKTVYGLSQEYLPQVDNSLLRTSSIQRIRVKLEGSTSFSDAVIPVGSYLYREAQENSGGETVDTASAYVLSVSEAQISGSDSIAYVYVLAERGSFVVDDTLICVKDPFAKQVELFDNTCAGNVGVSVVLHETATYNSDIQVNKYSGNVLYIQNIEPITLATNTIFTTRILLGF